MIDLAEVAIAHTLFSRPARRDLFRYIPAAFSAGVLSRAFAGESKLSLRQFPTAPRARLAVTSYPFRARIISPTNTERNKDVPGMDLKEFASFVVEKFDVHNITPLLNHFGSTNSAYLASFREAVAKAGSHVADLGLPGKRFYDADPGVRREAVRFGKSCVDVAVEIGSPSVRQHVEGVRGEKPDVKLAAVSLGELAEYGAKRDIIINLENDDLVSEDPYFLVAVIDRVGNPYLRALPDFGNCLTGHDAVYNHDAVKALLSHAFGMCHVKDSVDGEDGKLHRVDLPSLFQLAKSCSYRGYFCMEFERGGADPIDGTRHLVQESLRYLA
jgi:sugar phosphate isomerase/epimerase